MAVSSDPLKCKKLFLEENLFSEIELTDQSKAIGKLQEFDLLENDVWLLQCPKGMDVTELENQKLKIPGRTHINRSEAVSMEFNEGKVQRAFAYLDRKRRYAIRLLPVSGTIIVRDRLKPATTVSEESAGECPSTKRVPMPASIRVRHPLLGAQYEDKLELDKSVVERLQKADNTSAQILKESLSKRNRHRVIADYAETIGKEGNLISKIENNSADDDVEFVSEQKVKKNKKNKHEHSKTNSEVHNSSDTSRSRSKKLRKSSVEEEFVSQDLEWLKNI